MYKVKYGGELRECQTELVENYHSGLSETEEAGIMMCIKVN